MLQLIPAPLHRSLYRLADRLRKRWWRFRRPHRSSVNVVAFDQHGQVLLVRHSYGRKVWTLPGGGIGKGEDPALGIVREFREELDCGLADVVQIDEGVFDFYGSYDRVHLFAARVDGRPRPDMREVVSAEFFHPDALPPGCSRLVPGRVALAVAARRSEKR